VYKRPFYQIIESNLIEKKSIRQRESNIIESIFPRIGMI